MAKTSQIFFLSFNILACFSTSCGGKTSDSCTQSTSTSTSVLSTSTQSTTSNICDASFQAGQKVGQDFREGQIANGYIGLLTVFAAANVGAVGGILDAYAGRQPNSGAYCNTFSGDSQLFGVCGIAYSESYPSAKQFIDGDIVGGSAQGTKVATTAEYCYFIGFLYGAQIPLASFINNTIPLDAVLSPI